MLLTIVVTFLGTSLLFGILLWLACRRVASHLRGDVEATRVLVESVLWPLLGGMHKEGPPDVAAERTPAEQPVGAVDHAATGQPVRQ